MRQRLLFALVLFKNILFAQTAVSGNQSGTWLAVNSPYEVTGDITIPSGEVLTIEPGVEVEFQGRYRIYVDGQIIANGTQSDSIIFTAANPAEGWAGIRLDGTPDISQFSYCRFEYGKTDANGSYPDQHGGAVVLLNADAEFYHCVFANNDATGDNDGMGGAVYCMNTGSATQTLTRFEDCLFINNHAFGEGGAIKFTNDGRTQILRCEFRGNSAGYGGGALFFYTADSVVVSQCLFYENTASNSGGGAVKTLNPQTSIYFTNCTFTRNHADGYAEGGAVDLAYADAVFTNCIIYDNTQQYGKDVNIGQNATAVFNYCDVDMPDGGSGTNNLNNVDPLFVNPAGGDLHLQSNSPCIDAGTYVGLPYAGNAPDMGCYEYGLTAIGGEQTGKFTVFPVPATDVLFVERPLPGKFRARLLDATGHILDEKEGTTLLSFSLNSLPAGVYFLEIREKNGIFSRVIIKE